MLKNIFFIFLCFLVFGCTSTPPRSDFYKGNYQSALNKMQKIVDETPTGKDYAYHRIFLGSIAFTMGKYKMAQSVFKDALKVMESYGENPNQEIKAIIGSEAGKTYKGDPYEKMMVHYYIGMTYYFMKQYEKALAGFTNALSVDAMSPKPEYKKDCALLYFMAAKALLKSGEKEKALGFIKQSDRVSHTKNISKISLSDIENSNIIFIIETGKGPQKRRRGAGQSIEVLMPGECPEHIVRIFSNGKHIGNAKLVADIFFQSTTAGRSKFSGVREKKGVAKDLAAGLPVIQSKADIRCWTFLPGKIFIFTSKLPQGKQKITLKFFDEQGLELPKYEKTLDIDVSKDSLYYIRSVKK